MEGKKMNGGALSKTLKARKREIVILENRYGDAMLYATVESIERIWEASFELTRIQFQITHREAMKISESELQRMKDQFLATYGIATDTDHKTVVEDLITKSMVSSAAIIDKGGIHVEAVAQVDMKAVKTVLLFYPIYVITRDNYLVIRGGRKLFDDVTERTAREFLGMPGKYRWNEAEWKDRHKSNGAKATGVRPVQQAESAGTSELSDEPESPEDEEELKLIAALVEPATVPDRREILQRSDSYFDDAPPSQLD